MPDDLLTEPNTLILVEGVQNPYEEPFLWRVEMYLMSKYAPDFVEATIFKVRAAALERAKIVKEHHFVINDMAALQREIENDLNQHVRFQPQSFQPKSREGDFGQSTL